MKLPLLGGAYEARGLIANAQSCINLYSEPNPQDAPFPMTMYPTPGTSVLDDFTGYHGITNTDWVRGAYNCSNGVIVLVVGTMVIAWLPDWVALGQLPSNTGNPVSICDNGTDCVIVDGTLAGGCYFPIVNPVDGALTAITDPAFYASDRVDFIDTFLVFNRIQTNQFFTTTSNVLQPFDPTYWAAKTTWNDLLATIAVLHDTIWLFGNTTTEIWYNAGGAAFPFARMPMGILQQGIAAKYSVIVADNAVYWLSQDRWGRNMLMRGEGYQAKRVSNFAVENEWATYQTPSDCVGMIYQYAGHEFIGLWFRGDNAWWGYDATTQQWHRRTNGDTLEAWLPSCMIGWGSVSDVGYPNSVLAGDRTGPRLLKIDRNLSDDCGSPIWRQRSWMHVQEDGKRMVHSRFSAAMTGTELEPDTVNLAWSDDGGQTFGNWVPQTVANQSDGQYQWRRLGYARDRVYSLYWQGAGETALNGAWIDVVQEGT